MVRPPGQPPAVDVLMPVRNGRFLGPALESLLAQSFRDFRLLVVEDGADAAARALLAETAARDGRVEILRVDASRGLAATLNFGLAACTASLVARADADDIYRPDRLQRQVAAFAARPRLGVLSCSYRRIDAQGRVVGGRDLARGPEIIRFRTMFSNSILHPGAMFRLAAVRDAGGYDERFWTAQDTDLWARLSARVEIDNLPQRLVDWRVHDGSVMATRGAVGDRLGREVPLRQQTAYLGRAPDPETSWAAVETWRSFAPVSDATLRRGEALLARIRAVAQTREPRPVLDDFDRWTAASLARQAKWRALRPGDAARLLVRALAWRRGRVTDATQTRILEA